MEEFKPNIIGFLCNWCAYSGADSAARAERQIPENINIVRVMCSGRIDPQFVLQAFKEGADGVMILGCHPGECHYKEGNYNTLRWYSLLKETLEQFGIEEDRLILDWVSSSEGDKFVRIVRDMVTKVKLLGPLSLRKDLK